jgi:predicted transcriptional regulator
MVVDFTPEEIANLSRIANHQGTLPEDLVREAALRLIEDEQRFLEAVERAMFRADSGELIEHDEVVVRFERKYGT